jgi:hypothetical protein
MKCTLYLHDEHDTAVAAEIDFFSLPPNSSDIDEQNVIYEDGHYGGRLSIEDAGDRIESVSIFLNGETYIGKALYDGTGYQVRFEDEHNIAVAQPFLLLYDLLTLSVRVHYRDKTETDVQYSRYLATMCKHPEDTQNAAEMLKSLLNFEDDAIGDLMFGKKNTGNIDAAANRQGNAVRQKTATQASPQKYIQLLQSIVICYQSNLQYFNTLARHSIKKKNVIQSYSKARDISRNSFQWITQNADQLLPVSKQTGLYYRGEYYIPNKILTQEPVSHRDVYENQVVLSFLMLVLKNAQSVKSILDDDITEREISFKKIQSTVREGYQPPAMSVIWQMPLQESKDFCEKLSVTVRLLETLYRKYNEVLQCKRIEFKDLPRKTKTFQEIKPYSQVFGQISNWFRFGDFDMHKNRIIFNLRTLDKLFEYFSLYKLLKMLTDAGFDVTADEPVVYYEYNVPDELYVNETDVANTFHLQKDDLLVTLYYQPVIHSDKCENGITLFRTTIPRWTTPSAYYTPDFLIKLSHGNKPPFYAVLDSKYSNRLNILRRHADNNQSNYLDKMILKYSAQFASLETREAPKMIWVLQGRVGSDEERAVFRFHNSPLAKRFPPKANYGVISVNTKTDTLHELWNTIRRVADNE